MVPWPATFPSPPVFSPLFPECVAPFRETRQRRAEPPARKSTKLRRAEPPARKSTKLRRAEPPARKSTKLRRAEPPTRKRDTTAAPANCQGGVFHPIYLLAGVGFIRFVYGLKGARHRVHQREDTRHIVKIAFVGLFRCFVQAVDAGLKIDEDVVHVEKEDGFWHTRIIFSRISPFQKKSYFCRRMRKRNGFTSNCQPL